VCTGLYHGAVLSNNHDWEQACTEAGRNSGDLVVGVYLCACMCVCVCVHIRQDGAMCCLLHLQFPVVYTPELHFQEFASSVADMKNSVAVSLYNVRLFVCMNVVYSVCTCVCAHKCSDHPYHYDTYLFLCRIEAMLRALVLVCLLELTWDLISQVCGSMWTWLFQFIV